MELDVVGGGDEEVGEDGELVLTELRLVLLPAVVVRPLELAQAPAQWSTVS